MSDEFSEVLVSLFLIAYHGAHHLQANQFHTEEQEQQPAKANTSKAIRNVKVEGEINKSDALMTTNIQE